jgi:glycosyltransferase involved in cell wall biosynthesis
MIRVLFLLRSLDIGGTERQASALMQNMDHAKFGIQVVTFYGGGSLEKELDGIENLKILSLEKSGRWDLFSFLNKLLERERALDPDIIISFLDVPNIFNALTGKLLGKKIVLSARASFIDFSRYGWTHALVYRIGAFLSHFADIVITNSLSGCTYNISHGYSAKNISVIFNGIDTRIYYPNKEAGLRLRAEYGIAKNELVIGHVGRIDPMKDHPAFFQAGIIINQYFTNVRFVCVGDGPMPYRDEMKTLAESLGLSNLIWTGTRSDMPVVFNMFDILVSSSYGEGFSGVIGEGMASSIPCVVTDVGDSAFVVGETGLVVPPSNSKMLADAICKLLSLPEQERNSLGQKARQRVSNNFSIEKMVIAYQIMVETLANE